MGEMIMTEEKLNEWNTYLQDKSPFQIVEWVSELNKETVITTNFRPYEVNILHAVSNVIKDIKVLWCDTGYNTPQTYKHAEDLIQLLKLNVDLFVPKQTVAHRNVIMGIPEVDTEAHALFSEQVKLEPFRRAMEMYKPEVWFTNLRRGQTAVRDGLDILSLSKTGILKVSPFYNWSDEELDIYLKRYNLPNEFKYFDPTKVLENRECGIHI